MPRRSVVSVVATVILGVLLVAVSAVIATLGGFLNHCRGGYVHFGRVNITSNNSHVYDEWYWSQQVLARLLFAFPTGLVVIIFAMHLKGSLVVTILTWFSLFVSWSSYRNIGMYNSYCSPPGPFDWLLGRQAHVCNISDRFVREYSGMSLIGLVWTLPQGYILQQMGFGWEYSLSGCMMPLLYYIGVHTDTKHIHSQRMSQFIDGQSAVSEMIWGLWVWFVLIQCCLSQAVRRARIWIYKRHPQLGFKPFSNIEKIKYESLNRPILRASYECFVLVVTAFYCFTLIYYSLIFLPDRKSKGQTCFGLLAAILFLVSSQAWMWGVRYRNFLLKRYAKKLRGRTSTANAIYNGSTSQTPPSEERDSSEVVRAAVMIASSEMEHYEGLSRLVQASSTSTTNTNTPQNSSPPLLSWPYSHPDRLSPTGEQRQQVLDMSEHLYPQEGTQSYFILVWTKLERYVWLDIFILMRRIIGVLTLISTIFSIMMTITATIIGSLNPRFMDYLDPPCDSANFSL